MEDLLAEIRACKVCEGYLPYSPRPVVRASIQSKIAIIGQAPGIKVQNSGTPWNDASGDELRRWLDVSKEQFYDDQLFALVPMGFCYPGKGRSGDLPPRKECAPLWHARLFNYMPGIKLTLLIGNYAQQYYIKENFRSALTENVQNFRSFLPAYLPLVHPSPRNRIWQKRNPWFELEVVPELREIVRGVMNGNTEL